MRLNPRSAAVPSVTDFETWRRAEPRATMRAIFLIAYFDQLNR
jgi:hypothetical protein